MFIKEIFNARDAQVKLVSNLEKEGKTNDSFYVQEKAKENILKSIAEYVKTGSWLKHKSAREKVKLYIENNFSSRIVADILELNLNSVQASLTHASKELENKIGKNILKDIQGGKNLDDIYIDFCLKTGVFNIDSLFLSEFLSKLPDSNNSSNIRLSDCEKELIVLRRFTHLYIQLKVLSKLDVNKLAFIRYILETDDIKYTRERNLIFKFLSFRIESIEDLMFILNNSEPY